MKKFLVTAVISLLAVTAALLMLNLFATTEFQMEVLEAQLKIDLKQPGITEIRVPPLGKIEAETHSSPAGLVITLQSVDLNKLKKMIEENPETGELLNEVHSNVEKNFHILIYKALFLGFLGGLLSMLLLQRRRWYEYLYGAILGLVAVALVLTLTYRSFDMEAFQNPEYEGMLKTAPWMIGLVQEGIAKFDLWGKQLQVVADNLYEMFRRVESLEAMGPSANGDIRVLHVSDLHNNPAAFDFIEQVANTFKVDFIVDTGDISDFGTPLEGLFLERLRGIKVPYVFVPGNHESTDIIRGLQEIPNVRVLEGGMVTVRGVKIAGISDPSAYTQAIETTAQEEEATEKKLKEILEETGPAPEIVAVHNHRLAKKLAGSAPLILHGHDHAYKIQQKNDSVIIDAGSTGASGIGGLESKKDVPYSLVVLQLKKQEEGYRLLAADTIKVSNLQSGYSLERRVFPELYQQEGIVDATTQSKQ